ncbi:helix-turn-helix transcriptional regulator [Micromonospora tulbaghiae]|uniref:helix-turn-helix transcriptional regulator n=1 Tax=Micromonospora tulbaghiae TaxID=479978 RepID=UPI0033A4E68E
METTPKPDGESPKSDVARLRVEVYDALAKEKGLTTRELQAARHGIGRPHLSQLRSGRKGAGLALALRMAADLGTTVEALFARSEQ